MGRKIIILSVILLSGCLAVNKTEKSFATPESRDRSYYSHVFKPWKSPVFKTENEYHGFFMVKEFPDYKLLKKGMTKAEVEKILGETSSIDIDSFGQPKYEKSDEDDFLVNDDGTIEFPPNGKIKYISWDNNIGWSFCIKNKNSVDFLDIFIGFERRTDEQKVVLPGWEDWRIRSISIKKFTKNYQQLKNVNNDTKP